MRWNNELGGRVIGNLGGNIVPVVRRSITLFYPEVLLAMKNIFDEK